MSKYSVKETALVIEYWSEIPENFTGVVNLSGSYFWLKNGKRHRKDGPAIEHYSSANKQWYIKEWYLNGERHCDDGPAYKQFDGKKFWWLNGEWYSCQEVWFDALTSEQKEKAIWNMDDW